MMDQPTRRELLQAIGLGGVAARAGAAGRPNFLFLFTDDQRFNTLHALGNKEIHTPNMDRLVRRGVAFTHSCTMGGTMGAICLPSRGMLMTGQSLFHVHDNLIAPRQAPASARRPVETFPELLRKAGYDTFATGKWHNGPALYARSFSEGGPIFFGGMSDHDKVPLHDFDPSGKYGKERIQIRPGFSSELFSNSAIRFLTERKRANPFLAYVAYTSPHDPRMASPRFTGMYSPAKVKLPANFLPQHPFDNGDLRLRDEMLAPFPRTPEEIRRHIAAYYAMISEVDFQIGRVLDTLDQSGEAENTYIIFAGDNGLALGQHGLMGKQNLYDHSIRVPLVISGPGIPKGHTADSLCYLMDVGPTVLDLAGVRPHSRVAGKSLRPVLQNPHAKVRDEVICAYRHFQRGIRTDRWKLIEYNVGGKKTTQLFDVKKDPDERHDLAHVPAHAREVRSLHALLQARMTEYGDRTQLDADQWPVLGG